MSVSLSPIGWLLWVIPLRRSSAFARAGGIALAPRRARCLFFFFWGVMMKREYVELIDAAIARYKGDGRTLESAIGAFYLGFHVGWKPLRLMHAHVTFARYQTILGLNFMEVHPEVGPLAGKMLAWRFVEKVGNYWDVARGAVPGRSVQLE